MKKIEILFIRACKSKDPYKRVLSVYKRFYGSFASPESHVINILGEICDSYLKLKIITIIDALNPANPVFSHYDNACDYCNKCMIFLIQKIRYAKVAQFDGYIKPTKFR